MAWLPVKLHLGKLQSPTCTAGDICVHKQFPLRSLLQGQVPLLVCRGQLPGLVLQQLQLLELWHATCVPDLLVQGQDAQWGAEDTGAELRDFQPGQWIFLVSRSLAMLVGAQSSTGPLSQMVDDGG